MDAVECEVCGKRAPASRHPCRFVKGCSCWRQIPCRQNPSLRGWKVAELTTDLPVGEGGAIEANPATDPSHEPLTD